MLCGALPRIHEAYGLILLVDLIAFAASEVAAGLESALLVHIARQDVMLYELVQAVIVPRWAAGETTLLRGDAQRSLDEAELDRLVHAGYAKQGGEHYRFRWPARQGRFGRQDDRQVRRGVRADGGWAVLTEGAKRGRR